MDTRAIPEEIKAKLPIEEVISGYLPLKKAGRVFKGLCPFHHEKTPSFTVNPERQIYKCFGCGEGGDIFEFVMKTEGLTFPEALKLLADKAGVVLPEQSYTHTDKGPAKTRLLALNDFVTKLWHAILLKHPGAETARNYLQKRGLSAASIAQFQIGYAPLGQPTATKLQEAGYNRAEIQAAGDPTKFQDRITFPITDLTGRIIGFTGRLLQDSDDPSGRPRGPKYWNTPETVLFVKSRNLFALNLAKHAIQEKQLAILTEGQMDVIMLHQAGYLNTVASSGTALTTEQLELIRRFTPAIAFAYDSDKAGKEATKKGLELALTLELTPYVIVIPNGKDPADAILSSPEAWEKAYQNKQIYMDWILDQLAPKSGLQDLPPEQRKSIAKEIVGWLHRIQDPSEQADWFRKAAARLQTEEGNLRTLYKRLFPGQTISRSNRQAIKPAATQTSLPIIALALLLTKPEVAILAHQEIQILTKTAVPEPWTYFQPLLETQDLSAAINSLEPTLKTQLSLAAEEVLTGYDDAELTLTWVLEELMLILSRIRSSSNEASKAKIAAEIEQAQSLGDFDRIKKLLAELQTLV